MSSAPRLFHATADSFTSLRVLSAQKLRQAAGPSLLSRPREVPKREVPAPKEVKPVGRGSGALLQRIPLPDATPGTPRGSKEKPPVRSKEPSSGTGRRGTGNKAAALSGARDEKVKKARVKKTEPGSDPKCKTKK